MILNTDNLTLKIADSDVELRAAQRLRYTVFVEEMGASTSNENNKIQLERDQFDDYFDHLILIDKTIKDPERNVVGVYRLLRSQVAANGIGFYSASEYDLDVLVKSKRPMLELGRSCIHRDHRGGVALHMLWDGLANYVLDHGIEVLFGVASFHGTDHQNIAQALSFLHHAHLAPPDLRAKAQAAHYLDMNMIAKQDIEKRTALQQIPSLMKAYLRLGGFVGDGAYIDHDFNCIDVCLLMDTKRMSAKYNRIRNKGFSG